MALARLSLYALSYHYLWRMQPVPGLCLAFTSPTPTEDDATWFVKVLGICFDWYWYGRVLIDSGS